MEFIFENGYDPSYDVYEAEFKAVALKALRHLKRTSKVSIEVDLIDDQAIHQINRDYRHVDRPTDVISFAFDDTAEGEVIIRGLPVHDLGVILISVDRALAQAEAYGHSLHREMTFLFLHGLLHLCGYDHQNPADEAEMFGLQDAILGKKEQDSWIKKP